MTKAETEKLKPEEMEKLDVFAAAVVEGRDVVETKRNLAFAIKTSLARLYYPVSFEILSPPSEDGSFCSTLRAFEKNATLTADGVLSLGELGQLSRLADRATETNIIPSMRSVYTDGRGYVTAEGTWAMQGEKLAWPINHSSITCTKSQGTCIEFSVTVGSSSADGSPAYLSSHVEYYDLTQWTPDQVEARTQALCAETKLTINTKAQTAFSVNAPLDKPGCQEFDKTIGLPPGKHSPRLSTLENGFDTANQFYAERRQEAQKAFPPNVRELLARAQSKSSESSSAGRAR